jgi:hypothetical protein
LFSEPAAPIAITAVAAPSEVVLSGSGDEAAQPQGEDDGDSGSSNSSDDAAPTGSCKASVRTAALAASRAETTTLRIAESNLRVAEKRAMSAIRVKEQRELLQHKEAVRTKRTADALAAKASKKREKDKAKDDAKAALKAAENREKEEKEKQNQIKRKAPQAKLGQGNSHHAAYRRAMWY